MATNPPRPWVIDARDNEAGIAAGVFIRGSDAIEYQTNPSKSFVVGAKGMGKSLLLQKKYLHLVSSPDKTNHIFLPIDGDTIEPLSPLAFSFSKRSFRMLDSVQWWEFVWAVSLTAVAVYHTIVDRYIDSEIWGIIGGMENLRRRSYEERKKHPLYVHTVLQVLIAQHIESTTLVKILAQLRPPLATMDKHVSIFIDNVDEAFQPERAVSSDDDDDDDGADAAVPGASPDDLTKISSDPNQFERLGPEFSLTAQMGLLAAVLVLRPCKMLSVYASLRIEALDKRAEAGMWEQEEALCVKLRCTKEFAKEIFEANIAATPDERCARSDVRDDPYVRFLGFNKMPFLTDQGIPEPVFDFFYRHTLGRPRDLMKLGSKLVELDSVAGTKTTSAVRNKTMKCAGNCLKTYKAAILPRWDMRWKVAFGVFGTNVLSNSEIIALSKVIEKQYKISHPISYLVDRGLIGTVIRSDGTGDQTISFREPARYVRDTKVGPDDSPYYFLHPVVIGSVRRANQLFLIDRNTIVGNGCPFDPPVGESFLRIDGMVKAGLTVLIDSRTVRAMRDETNVAPAVFAAIAMAVWRGLQEPLVDYSRFAYEIKQILAAGICMVSTHGRPLEDVVDNWLTSNSDDIEDVVADLNWIISKHKGDKTLRTDYLKWDGAAFTLNMPGKVDCSALDAEVTRSLSG